MAPWPGRNTNLELQNFDDHGANYQGQDKGNNGSITTAANGSPDGASKKPSARFAYINFGDDDQMEIHGYGRSILGSILTWSFIVLTAGILRVIFHWFPEWLLKCTYTPCSLETADKVLIVEIFQKKYRRIYVRRVTCSTALQCLLASTDQSASKSNKEREDHVLTQLDQEADQEPVLSLPNGDGTFRDVSSIRMFTCKKLRYVWNATTKEFVKVTSLGPGMATSSLHNPNTQQGAAGLSVAQQRKRRAVYGSNYIHVPVKSIMQLLLLEVLNPFYIFQVVSIMIWISIAYYYFAGAIMIMSAVGVVVSVTQTRRNQKKLRNTVRGSDIIDVCRGGGVFDTIRTEELVPGDIIIIPSTGCTMHCDSVLLSGTCIVNESMLTGESVPVTKTPLPLRNDIIYHTKEHSRHTLFSGTKVVQTRFYDDEKVMAVVTSTGYMTAKGSLVSAIMYPPPVDFRFERDSYRFIGFLASLASFGLAYNLVSRYLRGELTLQVLFRSFDVITICVPPALPAAMTAGIILAQKRLKDRNIFCISPRSINVSGSLNCVCFDKTGTLTEEGLDLWGVVPIDNGRFLPPIKTPSKLPQALSAIHPISSTASSSSKLDPPLFMIGMATCHSLTTIEGVLSGDPLDLKMFESTGWDLVEPSNEDTNKYDNLCPTIVTWKPLKTSKQVDSEEMADVFIEDTKVEIGIVRQFPFSSSLQRMAILCKSIGGEQLHFFCKGSPEMIRSLSKPETVPNNYNEVLDEYTRQGYRVIALAHRLVEIRSIHKLQKVQREDLEEDLTFLGLVVLENRLKPDTTVIINQLSEADVRTIMVTGDNLLTAVSVARDCGMIPPRDQVIIINCEDANGSGHTAGSKPRLSYTLAERKVLQEPTGREEAPIGTTAAIEDIILDIENDESAGKYHLAITGKCWTYIQEHFPELVARCAVKGTIFARMSPDQKQQLVQELQQLGYVVGMCGDGANDCGALKAAHAGIALSDSEASVASPFTSKEASIACVPELIRQGRCALVTSFGIFKYMAGYSLTQFISVMILYNAETNLSDFQFLYIDLFVICSLSAVFGRTKPFRGPLHNRPPMTSLLSPPPIGSLLIQVFIIGFFQTIAYVTLQQQPWFEPYMDLHNVSGLVTNDFACTENYTIFSVSTLQYIILALAYAKGKPFRQVFFKNYWFVAALGACTAFSLYAMIDPAEFIKDWLELTVLPPMDFRLIILGLSLVQVFCCLLAEEFLVDGLLVKMMDAKFWLEWRPRTEKYLAIEKELSQMNWPDLKKQTEL